MNYNIILKNSYDHYYLFLDNEFQFDKDFGRKVFQLSDKKFPEILYSVILPLPGINNKGEESRLTIRYQYLSEKLFFKNKFENGLELSMMDYLISDESNNWEAFVSQRLELCLFGCRKEIKNIFLSTFNPYSQLTLSDKYNFISDAHIEFEELLTFLEDNFKLTVNSKL